ncbi:Protein REVEILLE 6 [Linum perenne]
MVSVNPNPAPGFFFFDSMDNPVSTLPAGVGSVPPVAATAAAADTASTSANNNSNTLSFGEDQSKKIRKPYTITKSRESWTEQEHDKFLEALQLWKSLTLGFLNKIALVSVFRFLDFKLLHLSGGFSSFKAELGQCGLPVLLQNPVCLLMKFVSNYSVTIDCCRFDRDWKKIEAFVGSKTVIQIRSHAQKYFLKVQKSGTSEHVPPPRPKRKAAHPYPQKAPKTAPVVPQVTEPFPSPSASIENGYIYQPDSTSVLASPMPVGALSSWDYYPLPQASLSRVTQDETDNAVAAAANSCCFSSSNDSTPRTLQARQKVRKGDQNNSARVMPDFAQVYSFIGSVFDPNASGHVEKLKQMDPINLETVMLLMRNLSFNLTSPEFEDHRKVLASYNPAIERASPYGNNIRSDTSTGSAIPAL